MSLIELWTGQGYRELSEIVGIIGSQLLSELSATDKLRPLQITLKFTFTKQPFTIHRIILIEFFQMHIFW